MCRYHYPKIFISLASPPCMETFKSVIQNPASMLVLIGFMPVDLKLAKYESMDDR